MQRIPANVATGGRTSVPALSVRKSASTKNKASAPHAAEMFTRTLAFEMSGVLAHSLRPFDRRTSTSKTAQANTGLNIVRKTDAGVKSINFSLQMETARQSIEFLNTFPPKAYPRIPMRWSEPSGRRSKEITHCAVTSFQRKNFLKPSQPRNDGPTTYSIRSDNLRASRNVVPVCIGRWAGM